MFARSYIPSFWEARLMAKLNTKVNLIAPDSIDIPLVRADHAATSNIFRVFFEVFLSLTSTSLGYILGLKDPSRFHWIALSACLILTIAFLVVSYRFGRAE